MTAPTTYQESFELARRAIRHGDGLSIETDAGEFPYWGTEIEQLMDELAPGEPFQVKALLFAPADDDKGHAWTITRDHLADPDQRGDKWRTGPGAATARQLAMLPAGAPPAEGYERHVFRMYDDDGELYYTGRAIFRPDDHMALEDALPAPLLDFGAPAAGCTRITWDGHPDWECS